jgi:hypothetical protein
MNKSPELKTTRKCLKHVLGTLLWLGVLVIAGAGVYFDWWGISTTSGSEHSQVNVTANKEKIRQGMHKARNQVGKLKSELTHDQTEANPTPAQK